MKNGTLICATMLCAVVFCPNVRAQTDGYRLAQLKADRAKIAQEAAHNPANRSVAINEIVKLDQEMGQMERHGVKAVPDFFLKTDKAKTTEEIQQELRYNQLELDREDIKAEFAIVMPDNQDKPMQVKNTVLALEKRIASLTAVLKTRGIETAKEDTMPVKK